MDTMPKLLKNACFFFENNPKMLITQNHPCCSGTSMQKGAPKFDLAILGPLLPGDQMIGEVKFAAKEGESKCP